MTTLRKGVLAFMLLTGAAAGVVLVRSNISSRAQEAAPAPPPKAVEGVASLGRIRPADDIVTLGARSISGQPSIIAELRVKEGDDIARGQVVAVLNSAAQLEAAWKLAETRVNVARARRDQVVAGAAKTADIAAQQAEILRLEVELANARAEHTRIENLFKQGLTSQAALDQSRLPIDAKPQLIAQARERLKSLSEVRQIDVDVVTAELQSALADVERAKAETLNSTIRSPYAGRVLKIHTWEGEEVGPAGIFELARVDRMYVIAEVAESDISRVRVGQRARVTGDSLPSPLEGTVEQLGYRVSRNSMTQRDPVGLTDARIVEVKILLDDASSVKSLIDALVEVVILP